MDNSNSYFCRNSNKKDKNQKAHNIWNTSGNDSNPSAIADKLGRSRKKLLDLTLRNRLLNFRPGNPRFSDDGKAHKQIPFQANLSSLWQSLVEDKKSIQVSALTREQLEQILGSFKNSGSNKELPKSDSKSAIKPRSAQKAISYQFDWRDAGGVCPATATAGLLLPGFPPAGACPAVATDAPSPK